MKSPVGGGPRAARSTPRWPLCGGAGVAFVLDRTGGGPAPAARELLAEIRRREPSARERRAWVASPEGVARTLSTHLRRRRPSVGLRARVVVAPGPHDRGSQLDTVRRFTRAVAPRTPTSPPTLVATRRGRHWVALLSVSPAGRRVRVVDPVAGPRVLHWTLRRWAQNHVTPIAPAPGTSSRYAGALLAVVVVRRRVGPPRGD